MATVEQPTRAQKEKRRKAVFRRTQTAEVAEIGKPRLTIRQLVIGRRLREKCRDSLEIFNVLAFPNSTGLKPFGQVQLDSIAHDESIIRNGGKICKAEPRAFGKTSRVCNAALWGGLYGYRQMIPVFSANMEKSKNQIMSRWKTELLSNDLLFWMFPELIWPLRALENKPQRCGSQTQAGRLTHTQWTADRIVFPHVPGCPGSGAILVALPLKSARGATHTMPDGTILRPDLCIFDDVQKDEDADNPNTIAKLEDLIDHTAMMLGGHSQTMSAIMTCTVRQPDDLSEQYLKKQGWRRVRYKMLAKPANNEKALWLGKYYEIRRAYNPESPDDQRRAQLEALQFYLDHRAEMDAGAEVTWDWAYAWKDTNPTEVSAIQHAYNILIDLGESVFAAECQNEPVRDTGNLCVLTPPEIRDKQSGYKRGTCPPEVTTLTLFVDPHPSILYWELWGWEPFFTGYFMDHGTFPDQRRRNFSHSILPIRLERMFPGHDMEARVTAALDALLHGSDELNIQGLLHREWIRTDEVALKIARCGIDANGEASDAVKKFIRQSQFSANLHPSFGRGVTARMMPMSQWQQSRGKNDGPEWVTVKPKPGEPPGVMFDTNYWKTKFHRALSSPKGSQGAIYLYKVENSEEHRRISEHWSAERPKEITCGSRTVYEWIQKPNTDNHDFDCAVGAMVAASKAGITSVKKPQAVQEISLRALQEARRGRR